MLLTGGTLARLAADGHRVVIVTATDGAMGPLTAPGAGTRLEELAASGKALGAAAVTTLGYADSGHGPLLYADPPDRQRFARADVAEAAGRLAEVIRAEHADLLLSYDARGGYGHRDHVQVHRVGALAAAATGVTVLEATVPRELVSLYQLARGRRALDGPRYTPGTAISHRIDVRGYARQKQAALAAHRSQCSKRGPGGRLLRLLLSLPAPLFGLAFGREWFAQPAAGAPTGSVPGDSAHAGEDEVTEFPVTLDDGV